VTPGSTWPTSIAVSGSPPLAGASCTRPSIRHISTTS